MHAAASPSRTTRAPMMRATAAPRPREAAAAAVCRAPEAAAADRALEAAARAPEAAADRAPEAAAADRARGAAADRPPGTAAAAPLEVRRTRAPTHAAEARGPMVVPTRARPIRPCRARAPVRNAPDPRCATCFPGALPACAGRPVNPATIARRGSLAAPVFAPRAPRARPVSLASRSDRSSGGNAARTAIAGWGPSAPDPGCASPIRLASHATAPRAQGAHRTVSVRPAKSAPRAPVARAHRTASAARTRSARRPTRRSNARAP